MLNPGSDSPRRKGWSDLVVKVCLVLVAGAVLGHYVLPRYFKQPELTDQQRWLARPKLGPKHSVSFAQAVDHSSAPCFFVILSGTADQTLTSGTVADCLTLAPDGKKLNMLELNLASGELFAIKTDLYVPDVMPLAFTRICYPSDDWSRKFLVYLPNVYDPYLTGSRSPYRYSDWLLPDRQTIHFERISPGTGYADYVAESKSADPVFAGSRIAWNGWGWDIAVADGTTYLSPEAYNATRPQQGSLTGIFDKDGHEVKVTRGPNGDLQEIISPGGKWIRLTYNTSGQVLRATDSSGDYVDYGYDSQRRLQMAHYSKGGAASYTYNAFNQVSGIADPSEGIELAAEYNNRKMPSKLTFNGESFEFRYFLDRIDREKRQAMAHIDIQKPHGEITRVRAVLAPDGTVVWSAEPPSLAR